MSLSRSTRTGTERFAVVAPLDVQRLARDLDLVPVDGHEIPVGHGGHSVTELVVGIARHFEHLDLLTLDPSLQFPVELRGGNVRLAVGPFRPRARRRSKDLFAAERSFLAQRLAAWQPDAVSAHWTYEYALGALDSGLPTLTTVRDWAPTILRHSPDAYRAVRLAMQVLTFARGSHFAAVSPYMARRVEGFTRRPCHVLPNALGEDWFTQGPASALGMRALAVNSGFGRRKNVIRLLEAWSLVQAQVPGSELVLVGSGYEEQGAAQRWAAARGLDVGVDFRGPTPRQQLPELLRSSRLFVHPALEESFGMVVLEAMAMGVPVVGGSSSGAVPWLLADGAGVLVDVGSHSDIASAVIQLLDDPGMARAVGQAGQRRAQDRFAVDRVARDYLDRLNDLAQESP